MCPLIDHGQQPMKSHVPLLYNSDFLIPKLNTVKYMEDIALDIWLPISGGKLTMKFVVRTVI